MKVRVIGGGLAGIEAAYQLLIRGITVDLYEMRPVLNTPIHMTPFLAELVCSNSLKSEDISTAQGLLKKEMSMLNSLVIKAAHFSKVPAGSALAVDRIKFSKFIEAKLASFDRFSLIREEVKEIQPFDIVATGPLSSSSICSNIVNLLGVEKLYFYDAVSPIITKDSIDFTKAFYGSRYNKGTDDYINCPLNEKEYYLFCDELINAKTVILKNFEKRETFSGCMPIEEMARKGLDSLRFGPLRPVGFYNQVKEKPWGIVQLRKEDNYDELYNLVGFQTNLTFTEQRRVFGLIPALKNADFVRYGVMHRNTYIKSPGNISSNLNFIKDERIFFAGQILGVEGYMESSIMGIIAGINMARYINKKPYIKFSKDTLSGALLDYVSNYKGDYQPMPVNFELFENKITIKDKKARKLAYSNRAMELINQHIVEQKINDDIINLR